MEKNLGIFGGITMVYGIIIGSGIFATVGGTMGMTENVNIWLVLIVWISGGILSLFGGFIYVELGMRCPVSGGEAAYFHKCFGKKLSSTFIFSFVYLIKCSTIAALAVTTGTYFVRMVTDSTPETLVIEKVVGAIIIFLCFLVNCIDGSLATKTQIIMTVLKTIAVLIVIGCGIYSLATDNLSEWRLPFTVVNFSPNGFFTALINISFSYEGWNILCYSIGDMRNPKRDLPIAAIGGVSFVLILYNLCVVSYITILGYDGARRGTTLALDISRVYLRQAYPIIPLLICCSTTGSLNGNLFGTSRAPFYSAFNGNIPSLYLLVHRKSRTPVFTLITIFIVSLIFLPFEFQQLLEFIAFVQWIFYFTSGVCLMILKYRTRTHQPTNLIKAPVVFVVIFLIYSLAIIVGSFIQNIIGCSVLLIVVIILFAIQFIPKRHFNFLNKFLEMTENFLSRIFDLERAKKSEIFSDG